MQKAGLGFELGKLVLQKAGLGFELGKLVLQKAGLGFELGKLVLQKAGLEFDFTTMFLCEAGLEFDFTTMFYFEAGLGFDFTKKFCEKLVRGSVLQKSFCAKPVWGSILQQCFRAKPVWGSIFSIWFVKGGSGVLPGTAELLLDDFRFDKAIRIGKFQFLSVFIDPIGYALSSFGHITVKNVAQLDIRHSVPARPISDCNTGVTYIGWCYSFSKPQPLSQNTIILKK